MRQMILASHGSLAKGMKTAVAMIAGQTEGIFDFNLDDYYTPDEIKEEIENLIKDSPNEFIVMTDIKGGSVCTALNQLCRYDNVTLATTMSLPLVLEVYMQLESGRDTFEMLSHAVSSALRSCVVLNKEIIFKKTSEGKEEEDW